MISTAVATQPTSSKDTTKTDPAILFGSDSISNVSHVFPVDLTPVVIEQFGLSGVDAVYVERVGGAGSGQYFQRLKVNTYSTYLGEDNSILQLNYPGRYRLVYDGTTPLGSFLVQQVKYSLSSK